MKTYNRTALTGGVSKVSLDAAPWADLKNEDLGIVTDSGRLYVFRYNASSSAAENVSVHPFVIKPDDAGENNGRWVEQTSWMLPSDIDHTLISNVGTYTHDQIDAFIAEHFHLLSEILDHPPISGTPGSGYVPIGGPGGKLPIGWIPSGVDAGYLDGVEVSAAGPASGQALVYSEVAGAWVAGDVAGSTPDASESVKGIAELATTAEAKAGDDDTRIITPAKLAAVIDDLGLGKNLFINGNMDVWQRGAGPFSGDVYTADRWLASADQSTSRSTDVPSNGISKYSIDISKSVSSYNPSIRQRIEAQIARMLITKPIALTFWAKRISAESVDLVVHLRSANSEDYFGTTTERHSTTFSAVSTSWSKYEFKVNSLDTNFANGLMLYIYASGGTAACQIRITQVQLELGSHATEFEVRQPATEQLLCERYCQVIDQQYWRTRMTHYLTNEVRFAFNIPTMRATPTLIVSGTAGTDISLLTPDGSSQTGFTFDGVAAASSNKHVVVRGSKTSHSITDGFILFLTTSAKIIIDAEL